VQSWKKSCWLVVCSDSKRAPAVWDVDFEKCEQGPQSNLFRNNRQTSEFNVEVEGVDVGVINYCNSLNSRLQAQVSHGVAPSEHFVPSEAVLMLVSRPSRKLNAWLAELINRYSQRENVDDREIQIRV
jgi:uncharacterized UBP type Zn finger protein